jgi:hypothetical protein
MTVGCVGARASLSRCAACGRGEQAGEELVHILPKCCSSQQDRLGGTRCEGCTGLKSQEACACASLCPNITKLPPLPTRTACTVCCCTLGASGALCSSFEFLVLDEAQCAARHIAMRDIPACSCRLHGAARVQRCTTVVDCGAVQQQQRLHSSVAGGVWCVWARRQW